MLRLFYSNRIEALVGALADNLRGGPDQGAAGPFEPVRIVVPNRHVEAYLKLELARRLGIAAGLSFTFLGRLAADMVAALDPGAPGGARLVDGPLLEGLLLGALHDDALLAAPALAPVRDYLLGAGDRADAVDLRRAQLAARLSALWEEYHFSRPELAAEWSAEPAADAPGAGAQAWQRHLWHALLPTPRPAAAQGPTPVPMSALAEAPAGAYRGLGPLHVFGLSYVARTWHRALGRLGRDAPVLVYAPNPCREYWEDLASEGERRGRRRNPGAKGAASRRAASAQISLFHAEDPYGLGSGEDPPALRLWGRPGRENVRLLNEATGSDFEGRFVDPCADGESTLRRLQRDILERAPEHPSPPQGAASDGSIQFLSCPGIRREIESVAARIWQLVRADDDRRSGGGERPLRWNDIAVIVPSGAEEDYLGLVGSIFRESHDLPHAIVDLPLSAQSRIVEAADLLLDLPLGRMGRNEVLRFLGHPHVVARVGQADPELWGDLCAAAGIVHGADRSDHQGSYLEHDLLSWDQGLRRLALGTLMAGPEHGAVQPFVRGEESYLPATEAAGDTAGTLALVALARALLGDVRTLRQSRLSPAAWGARLAELIGAWLVPDGDEDEAALRRLTGALHQLDELPGDTPVGYRVARELARQRTGTLRAARGQYLADGVVVSSFVPMRALPFRVVFVLGLQEGVFPAPERADHLDVRTTPPARRRPGDVTPRERDRTLFLETLLGARDRLILSWVGASAASGDPLSPSSCVVELRQMLARGYLGDQGLVDATTEVPALRHRDPPTCDAFPEAERESDAAQIGASLRAVWAEAPSVIDGATLRALLSPEAARELAARTAWIEAPGDGERGGSGGDPSAGRPARTAAEDDHQPVRRRVRINLGHLRKFLECPLQGAARLALGLRPDDGDDGQDEERLTTPFWERGTTLAATLIASLRAGAGLDEAHLGAAYLARTRLLELGGRAPTGAWGRHARDIDLGVLGGWRQALAAVLGPDTVRGEIAAFGGAAEGDDVVTSLPPVALDVDLADGRRLRVELVGQTQALLDDGSRLVSVVPFTCGFASKFGDLDKRYLRGYCDALMLAASGRLAGRALDVRLVFADGEHRGALVAPATPAEAASVLADLVTEALGRVHDYLLPCEAVMEWHQGDRAGSLRDAVLVKREDEFHRISSDRGPVSRPRLFDPPSEEEARAMVARRFAPFFARLGSVA